MRRIPLKKGLILACLTVSSFFFMANNYAMTDDPYAESYEQLENPQPPMTQTGKIEVVEFFWYRCGHCYHLEGPLENWLKKKPDDVEFIRIPAVWPNYSWAFSAKAFYSAKELGILEEFHPPYFKAIHKKPPNLTKKEWQLINQVYEFFYTTEFLEPEEVEANRKLLGEKIEQAKELTKDYDVQGVPVIYVNGRYRLTARKAANYKKNSEESIYDKMLEILDYLIKKERNKK
jgi:protein dithiol oxidoreductase (disulfide-forming)